MTMAVIALAAALYFAWALVKAASAFDQAFDVEYTEENMNAIDKLKSVLCNHEGGVCIAGKDADREIIAESLSELERMAERLAVFEEVRNDMAWISVDEQLPEVEIGGEMHCFLLLNLKHQNRKVVVDAYWLNKPKDDKWGEEIDAPDWALESEDDGFIGIVGWADNGNHPDFSNYYTPFETTYRDIIAWIQVNYPQPSEIESMKGGA